MLSLFATIRGWKLPRTLRLNFIVLLGSIIFIQIFAPSNLLNEKTLTQIPSNGSGGALSCKLVFNEARGVLYQGGDVEGWPLVFSLPKEWKDSHQGLKVLEADKSTLFLESTSAPSLKLTFRDTLRSGIRGTCLKGEIQILSYPDGVTNAIILPETLISDRERLFQVILSENTQEGLELGLSRVISGAKFSLILFSFVFFFWLVGNLMGIKSQFESRVIFGALFSFLIIGGLNYFFQMKLVTIILMILLVVLFVTSKKKRKSFVINPKELRLLDFRITFFIIFLGQFVSSLDFRSIGLLQTDTYNYRSQVDLFQKLRLLDLTYPSEGFGARSIDYSNRSWIQLITQTNSSWAIIIWGGIWLTLVVLAGRMLVLTKHLPLIRNLWVLSLPGLLGLWVEGYLSRFSVAAATVIAVLILHTFNSNERDNTKLILFLAAYSFAIVPVFLPLITILPVWYFINKRFLYALKLGIFTLLIAAPASLWMRNIQVAFGFANDGILDGIARNIVVPNWNQLTFPAQILGFVSWHGGGVRYPVSKFQIDKLGLIDKTIINLLPFLVILSFSILYLLFFHSIKENKFDPPRLFLTIVFLQLVTLALFTTSFYVTIMYVITLGPIILISLFSSKSISKTWYRKIIGIAIIACLITAMIEGSLWFRNPNGQVAVNSYWANGVSANKVIKSLDGMEFSVAKGAFTSDYSFFIRASEIGLVAETNQCANCMKNSRGIDIDSASLEKVQNLVVIFGNCPRDFLNTRSIGAYSLCSRVLPMR
jgi:hypothetical protein